MRAQLFTIHQLEDPMLKQPYTLGALVMTNYYIHVQGKVNSADYVGWPPTVEEVASAEEPDALLKKFLVWLKDPAVKPNGNCNDASVVTIASLISSLITGKRTLSKSKLGLTLHGLTRSREIIDILHKLGISISYNDVLNLHSSWAMYKSNKDECPIEIAYDTPDVAVMDNDDFKDETLTGADMSHRTNVMFVRQLSLKNDDEDQDRPKLVKSEDMTGIIINKNRIEQYKTKTRGIPKLRTGIDITSGDCIEFRITEGIHTLARIDNKMNSLMMNTHSLRTQNWESFKCYIRLMLPWLVIYDNNNYGKWLVEYWLEMTNLPPKVNQIMTDGYFNQSMTGNPYSCLQYDLWI